MFDFVPNSLEHILLPQPVLPFFFLLPQHQYLQIQTRGPESINWNLWRPAHSSVTSATHEQVFGNSMKRHQSGSAEERVKKRVKDVVPQWEEFYNQARTLFDKGEETIDKAHSYGFPKDDDPTLDAACEALNAALEKACKPKKKKDRDTAEIKQALKSLRKAYDKAAKSNTVTVHYIDAEPPTTPSSPLADIELKKILLARPWMKEVIKGLRDQSVRRLLILGNPGSGEFHTYSCP
jgi:hypothetical protein